MRKLLAFLLLTCMHFAARGQTSPESIDLSGLPEATQPSYVQYWFDDAVETLQQSSTVQGEFSLDATGLLEGMHTVHYQLVDSKGTLTPAFSSNFIKFNLSEESVLPTTLRYWFDDDENTMHVVSAINGIMNVDVLSLLDGLHTIHYQAFDDSGKASCVSSAIFMIINTSLGTGEVTAKRLLYWYDDDIENLQEVGITPGPQMLDASNLQDGLHTIHYQVLCSDGSITSACSSIFMRFNNVENGSAIAKSLLYWFDDQEDVSTVAITGETQMVDASSLMQGLHTIHYQVVDMNGQLGTPVSSIFMKMDAFDDVAIAKKQRYWFDDDATTMKEGDVISGAQMLDVSDLPIGLHTLHYQLFDENNDASVLYSSIFMKMPEMADGENVITRYMYWLNDYSKDNVKVELAEPASHVALMTLLPMEEKGIRSSDFHFEFTNGVPMMYANNDIHVRFYDTAGYWSDDTRSFTDYRVKREVTDVTLLQVTQTFPRVAENDVKWFSFEAERGDSIAFKASQATSLQVYAPSGKIIYAASGDKSVVYGGAHTWEDGTFYVAIHDVTGTKQDVTLDYQHIDRYAILDWDVHLVGNGGCSTITFNGNGFDDLYEIELVDTNGTILKSANLSHDSNVTISARFNFTDVALGDYKAIFHFTTEDKIVNSVVNVVEAKDISIKVETIYANRFLLGTANTYTIRITNNGNSTAYQVPLKIQIQADGGTKNITSIVLSDNLITPNFNWIDSESYSQEEQLVLALIKEMGDRVDFLTVKDTLDNEEFMEGYFAINLPPLSTTEFTVSLKSVTPVTLYTLVPDEWDFYAYYEPSEKAVHKVMKKSAKGAMCCAREHVECVMNLITGALDYASIAGGGAIGLASCIASLSSSGIQFAYDRWCGESSEDQDEAQKSLIRNLTAAALGCVSKYDPTKMTWMIQHVYDVISTSISCFSHPKKIPNCPPKPPKPNPSTPVVSLDPNDIYGYTSESGSKFINDEVRELNYRIEFENDPEHATASAHVVTVENKLDGTYFDLSTYAPTAIKIGDKTEILDGTPNFVKTIDMRPEINAIAEVSGTYDAATGMAKWTFTSIDPMTMEPTDDVMQGFLPVNYDGISGIGEVLYDISLKDRFPDGTQIKNQAIIIFDNNDPIETPVWTNIIDAVAPTGHVVAAKQKDYETATLTVEGTDERSGVWAYDVYVQYGTKAEWLKVAEKVSPREDGTLDVKVYEGINHGFYVCAVDSAGNVEMKEPLCEVRLDLTDMISGDANGDGSVSVGDMTTVISALKGESPEDYDVNGADANHDGIISVEDLQAIIRRILRK